MQNPDSIIPQPFFIGLVLSIGVHAAVLLSRGIYTPPIPQLAAGRTVVHLTLIPSQPTPISQPQTETDLTEVSDVPHPEPVNATNTTTVAVAVAAPAGVEQHATLDAEEGVISEAVATSGFKPAYPRISKNRGEEGSVALAVLVRPDGSVANVEILQSSGYHRLDAAAVKGAYMTAFQPASRRDQAVEATVHLSYTFRLTDD